MAKPTSEIKDLRSTKRYAKARLPELRQEIKDLAKQKTDLVGELKKRLHSGPADEVKAVRSKAAYVKRRLRLLKDEAKELGASKKASVSKLRTARASSKA